MSKTTENLSLIKPEMNEKFNTELVFNDNMEILDSFVNHNYNEINFYIENDFNNKLYDKQTALRGMTFREWYESDYNNGDLASFSDSGRIYYNGNPLESFVHTNGLTYAREDEEIAAYHLYKASVCCFEKGTKILISLEGETKNIEDIRPGDIAVSYNGNTKEFFLNKVIGLKDNNEVTDIAEITLENDMKVRMNAYHPLLTIEGYKSLTQYKNLPLLTLKDTLVTFDGEVKIKRIFRYNSNPEHMYNLCMSDESHNYIANGIVAHNAAECPE